MNKNRDTDLESEITNFQKNAKELIAPPEDIPILEGIDIYGMTLPLKGTVGGDHIIYIDFNKRYNLDTLIKVAQKADQDSVVKNLRKNQHRAGILIADVSGHSITDYLIAAQIHQAFLVGVLYELEIHGKITTELFEKINTRIFNSSAISKFVTMLYGEIGLDGRFKFISAGHCLPMVFSAKYDKFMQISTDRFVTYEPLGLIPTEENIDQTNGKDPYAYKKKYTINEINLMGSGDILILYSDGLVDLEYQKESYVCSRLENQLRKMKSSSAREICQNIEKDIRSNTIPNDDITYVIIKKE